eukprot:TRINITY_DN6332_c0_g2_i4.p1 TRINITY_DN6332_c0_g2~~TRINITY_DN6332_c0_g2_i4.p1  ORF type:complete len:383 (-),score=90.87 TRINITY_DN6332_c0_g2_i4:151-1299(-)
MLKLLRDEHYIFFFELMAAVLEEFSLPEMKFASETHDYDTTSMHLAAVLYRWENIAKTGKGLNIHPSNSKSKLPTMASIDARTEEDTPTTPTSTFEAVSGPLTGEFVMLEDYVEALNVVCPPSTDAEKEEEEAIAEETYDTPDDGHFDALAPDIVQAHVQSQAREETATVNNVEPSPDTTFPDAQIIFIKAAYSSENSDGKHNGKQIFNTNRAVEGYFALLKAFSAGAFNTRDIIIEGKIKVRLAAARGRHNAASRLSLRDPRRYKKVRVAAAKALRERPRRTQIKQRKLNYSKAKMTEILRKRAINIAEGEACKDLFVFLRAAGIIPLERNSLQKGDIVKYFEGVRDEEKRNGRKFSVYASKVFAYQKDRLRKWIAEHPSQ